MDDTPFRKLDKPAYMPQPPPEVETSDEAADGKTGEQEGGQVEKSSQPWDGSLLLRGEKLLPYGPDAISLLSQLPEMYTNYANPKYEYVDPLFLADSHSLHALASKYRRQLRHWSTRLTMARTRLLQGLRLPLAMAGLQESWWHGACSVGRRVLGRDVIVRKS